MLAPDDSARPAAISETLRSPGDAPGDDPGAPLDHAVECLAADARRRRRAMRAALGALAAAALAVLGALVLEQARASRWERAMLRAIEQAPRASAIERYAGDDRLYGDLLPQWYVALARVELDPHAGEYATAVLAALARDAPAGVRPAVERLRALDEAGVVAASPARALPVFDEWNAALDATAAPYHFYAAVERGASGPMLGVNVYHTVRDAQVPVGAARVRVRVLERLDGTNLTESWLGLTATAHEGAMVVLDRVRDFTLREVWPALAGARSRRPLAAAMSAEARRALAPAAFDTLVRAARAHAALGAQAEALGARAGCGAPGRGLRFAAPGWQGYDRRALERLVRYVARGGGASSRCRGITREEAGAVVARSLALARTPGLRAALGALIAWMARAVAVHEARHAADRVARGEAPPWCAAACEAELDEGARDELSAYLASFAAEGTAYVALFQACSLELEGAHRRALRFVRARIPGLCEQPPEALAARAQALERELLGRSEPASLPAEWAAPLAVAPRR